MRMILKHVIAVLALLVCATAAFAQDASQQAWGNEQHVVLQELNLNIELLPMSEPIADNSASPSSLIVVPNIPDSAFKQPLITENNIHMYLGLASLAMGAVAGISAPEDFDPDLLNTVHFKAAKASWQLGAAAVATGFYAHWDDFHLEDGLLDPDNLHILLGLAGTIGYYLAVKGAVDEYNDPSIGYPTENHSTPGIFGGAAMTIAIGLTW
ncbi:MAG: hypothetical protein Q9M19_08495 [Mariprofundaceae bacterium]|nr:hypothetical protein [Mariprofundaceae bacterium]